jgi:hypothetical protein
VDNVFTYALEPEEANTDLMKLVTELRRLGLPVHEIIYANPDFISLGWNFERNRMVPKGPRRWRIRLGCLELAEVGFATGRQIEAILSHYFFVALGRRRGLSVMSSVYAFSEAHYLERVELWPSVVRELKWMAALVPLLERDLSLPWADQLLVYDAAELAGAVCAKPAPPFLIAEAGRVHERWRYRDKESIAPRERLRTARVQPLERLLDESFEGYLTKRGGRRLSRETRVAFGS